MARKVRPYYRPGTGGFRGLEKFDTVQLVFDNGKTIEGQVISTNGYDYVIIKNGDKNESYEYPFDFKSIKRIKRYMM